MLTLDCQRIKGMILRGFQSSALRALSAKQNGASRSGSAASQFLWGQLYPCTAPLGSCDQPESTAAGTYYHGVESFDILPPNGPSYAYLGKGIYGPHVLAARFAGSQFGSALSCSGSGFTHPLSALWYNQRPPTARPQPCVLITTTTAFLSHQWLQ